MAEARLTSLLAIGRFLDADLLWALGMIVGMSWAVYRARAEGLDRIAMYWGTMMAGVGGVIGGHWLGLVVYDAPLGPWSWLEPWTGGKSWYGGFIGGAAGAIVFWRARGLPWLRYCDALAPAVGLGYAIGRIGCFVHGDDAGVPTSSSWSVVYPRNTEAYLIQVRAALIPATADRTLPVIPAQLLLSLLGLVLFFALRRRRAALPPGARVAGLLIFYSAGRFVVEFVRADFRPVALGLSLQQIISIAVAVAVAGAIALMWRRPQASQLAEQP